MTTKEKTIAEPSIDAAAAMKERNLMQRISAIQKEVSTVEKAANVDGKYKAVTHDDVTRMIRPLMVKHGVVSFMSLHESVSVDTGVLWKQRKAMQLQSKFLVTYINVDRPDDRYLVAVEAHADGADDKNPGKVMSYAQKYADLKTFRISTGEDDEQKLDEKFITEQTLTAEHLADLVALADEYFGDDSDSILTSMATNVFRVAGYTAILDKHFQVAINKLKAKQAEKDDA